MTATDVDLSKYPEHVQHSIQFDADCWFRGDVARSARMWDSHVEWARKLTPDQRAWHRAGAWYDNRLLMDSAISHVQCELNDDTGDRVFGHKKVCKHCGQPQSEHCPDCGVCWPDSQVHAMECEN